MHFADARTILLMLALAACGGDCSCRRGCGEAGVDPTGAGPGAQGAPGAAKPGGAKAGAVGAGAGSGAAGSGSTAAASAPGTATATATGSGATAAPDGAPEVLGELIDAPTLRATLPDTVGNLKASTPARDGPVQHERKPVRNVSRRYKLGARDLYVEVVDTAQAPELRASVLKLLSDPAAIQAPQREPIQVAGTTGLTTGFPAQRASGVIALLGGRYFVNARLEGSDDMQEAARLLQGMDWSALAAGDGGAGSGAH